jgi:enoyl-CoA hydratase/carnithine racemase
VSFTTITAGTEERVGILTFNRPQVLNAFNPTLIAEVGVAMRAFERTPPSPRSSSPAAAAPSPPAST